jgi:molybdate transport system ATP-binding protein
VNAPLVELTDVEIRHGDRAVLSHVSLALREGVSWALLGPNGSGKSSLLRVLRGELWLGEGAGRRVFCLDGQPETSPIGARERIGMVSPELQQEYIRRDWSLPAEAVVRSGFTDSLWPPEPATPAQAGRIAEVMAELGVAHLAARSILTLSNGEARRVLLARATVGRPRLLFLDEPCHGLDAASRAGFLALVSRIAARGTPIVLATHRYGELVPEITQVAVLHAGRVLAQGAREEVLALRLRSATLRASGDPVRSPTPGAGGDPFALSVGRQAGVEALLEPLPLPGGARAGVRGGILLEIENADVHVEGRPALCGLSWTVRAGERWAVVGPNGAGKSTLLRVIVGDEQAMPGGRVSRLELGDRACVWDVKARVGIASPELQARHRTDVLAEDVVASGFTASIGLDAPPSPAERAAAARWMARLGVAHLAGRRIHALSYGELRKLILARALVRDPELLVLDEPCDGLDPESRAALLADVQRLCEQGLAMVLVTHHPEDLVPAIDHVLELDAGRTVYQGPRAGWRPAWAAAAP